MAKFAVLTVLALLLAPPVQATDLPASAASVKELISLVQGSKLFESMVAQMDSMIDASMKQAAQGREVTPEQQKVLDDTRAKMVALVKETLNWDSLEPRMVEIYQKSFSQFEMDGMLKFYKSPVGKAVLAKMPVVVQNSMQIMQGVTADMLPKIQQIVQEAAAQVKALDKQPADNQGATGPIAGG